MKLRRVNILYFCIIALTSPLHSQPLADGQSKFLGNIINNGSQVPDSFMEYWNQVTPENAGKWGDVEKTRDKMSWTNLDLIYDYAKDNDLPFRQHNFVWGQQQPGWMDGLSLDEQRDEVEEWIRLFGERYPDADFIDVVNEPMSTPPSYKNALGGDGATGWDWVIWTFEKARYYCPNAKLHINEYGIFNGWRSMPTFVKIINLLKERNLIDGVCEEGHFLESVTKSQLSSKLNELAKTGLPIYITEYDINIQDDAQHLAKMQEQFPILYGHKSVAGVTMWGYIQGAMWRADGWLLKSDGTERQAMEWLREFFAGYTGVDDQMTVAHEFVLQQNYPNPFNPSTEIRYDLANPGHVRIDIVNTLGRSVCTLMDQFQPAGSHSVQWYSRDDSGHIMPSGIYFYNIAFRSSVSSYHQTKKMLLVR
jgi:endo-1,4-beta-xylanase